MIHIHPAVQKPKSASTLGSTVLFKWNARFKAKVCTHFLFKLLCALEVPFFCVPRAKQNAETLCKRHRESAEREMLITIKCLLFLIIHTRCRRLAYASKRRMGDKRNGSNEYACTRDRICEIV